MAKLVDGIKWIEDTLGDPGRANSIMVKGREQGLFSKGKRGGIAPELILDDYAYLLLAAISSGAPTKIKSAVEELMAIPLVGVEIDLNDGASWRGPFEPDRIHDDIHVIMNSFDLSLREASQPKKATVFWVIHMLLMGYTPRQDFKPNDKLELIEQGAFKRVTLTLHENKHRVGLDGWPLEGPGHNALRLSFENDAPFDPSKIQSTRTLFADALNGLASMTKWMEGQEQS